MDRANWDFGKTTINILMISVTWNGMGIPLLWMLLSTAGNSHTSERTELLDRLRAAFPDLKIATLMGDREFIGDAWMAYLQRENIPFAGSDGGAARWATVCSLISTAKLNDVEPFAYLKDVPERMSSGHPMSRLDELLPWNWAPADAAE